MHRVCKWGIYVIATSIVIYKRYALEAIFTNIFFIFKTSLKNSTGLFSAVKLASVHSILLHSTPLDARSKTLSGKHEYLAAAASHQLSDQIGVAGSEERRYQTAERRGLAVRRGSHLSPLRRAETTSDKD